jgi:hypothetical protein
MDKQKEAADRLLAMEYAGEPTKEDSLCNKTAVFCMGYLGGFEKELVEAAESESPAIRSQAFRALRLLEEEMDFFAIHDEIPGASDIPATGDSMLLSALKGIHPDLPGIPKRRHQATTPPGHKSNDAMLDDLYHILAENPVPWDDELLDDAFDMDAP